MRGKVIRSFLSRGLRLASEGRLVRFIFVNTLRVSVPIGAGRGFQETAEEAAEQHGAAKEHPGMLISLIG